ncbi:hypothetical protein D3C73_1550240 [compost metagenome]
MQKIDFFEAGSKGGFGQYGNGLQPSIWTYRAAKFYRPAQGRLRYLLPKLQAGLFADVLEDPCHDPCDVAALDPLQAKAQHRFWRLH